ncbi:MULTISPECIES: DNA primase [Staphylococcus]|uniref:DNA primase n=1 Tax=Staphylococcus haemolyticus TaxID=1283 RepID=A0A2K0A7Q9_STAHA|nr:MULTISPECIES: DNA primase [Staphylococcus]KGF27601.1 DNA primase [Staphylococcus haemolyticus DNF00585]MCH4443427.1 DNA primase [Staphylococcus haemolyticus]OFK30544.1 DNA primase [Staphylococcus sp. HMSC065C10]OFL87667.1 DNA primase [Staphylococcus sp. HMSC069D12]PNN21060.1 DNA primase [Staphylococcus haemolyticus]
MRIEQSVINEIKDKTDILDLVSEYVKLEKRGRNYIGLCPFHDEKTPSFTVSEDKQICHCFGCKKGGNVFQFTQEIKDLSFVEAVKELGERINISVDIGNSSDYTSQIASNDLTMIEMHELMHEYYQYALLKTVEGEEALNYLIKRGFTEKLIKSRGIGYAPNHTHFCHDFLQQKGYDIELAYEAGLLSRNEENFSYFDRFRDRIMFPLNNAQGRIVGYSGRTYNNQEPKYLNSPETPIFQKRRLLYNLDNARKYIRKNDEAILLEGFMDVIKSDSSGLKPVIASMGTAISDEHITVLKKLTSHITLMFDGDFAGQEATIKTGQHFLQQGFNVFVVQLPKDMDPDEYITKYGNEKFLEYVNNEKKSFIIYKVNKHKDEIANNDLAYERYLKEVTQDIALMNSQILQNKIIKDVAHIFNVDSNTLNSNVLNQQQYIPSEPHFNDYQSYDSEIQNNTNNLFSHLSKHESAERALLKHFMNDKDLFLNYHKQLESDDFDNQFFKRIYSVLEDFYAENDSYTISDMILYTDNDNLRDAIIALDNYDLNQEPYDSEIEDYMNVINESKYGDTLEELNHKLREASRIGDVELQKYYLEQIVNKNKARM